MTKERILVTSALPYANGPLHVGHAIGAYIPADVYTRYHRLKGDEILFICGTDEHGTPIAVTAEQEGISPQEVVDKYYRIIKKAFSDLGISFDNFSRTSRKIHYELSQKFFLNILENGFIYKKIVERPYCPRCKRFLPDRYVKGTCPYCGSNDERGDQCEACGKQLEPHELKEPYCAICREIPEMKETEHWFFRLSEFSERLREWISGNRHWPDNARNFCLAWIKEGLKDRAITRDLDWGIPVPIKGSKGKVLYVWFDAPIGYISATKEWALGINKENEWKKYWCNKAKIVHFIGKDNIPFHAVIWPAMLLAHGNFNLPWQISSNEYLTLEGRKMSTSRGWILWLHNCLEEFEPDALRYYLLSINPERHDADFSLREFQHRVNNELIATFGNFIHRSLIFIEKKGSVIPKIKEFDGLDEEMLEFIRESPGRVGRNLEKFRFLDALRELMNLAHHGNEYFQKKEPWKNENSSTLYLCANLCRTLAILCEPFLPFTAEKIWKTLNLEGSVHDQDWNAASELGVKEGHKIGKVEVLFKRIEDEEIEDFESKFLKLKLREGKEKMEYIEFDEFEKLDIRIGRIKGVRDHPRADKLYLLNVDLGSLGERQLVAGIKEAYKKEELIGKDIVVVANLKPVKLRGQKSEGMLLAADVDGKPVLLTIDKGVKPGTKIR
ncbi:MAG: methionine--tRNA ligase [Candidatus Altiarchaeales archaeon]|nr:MAG: methionine--tRNA ligase [Candidatus Altiarchaeales archaeon]